MDIVKILVVLSITMCSIVLIFLSVKTDFVESLSFTIVLLVASIPMAIEIVTTTTLALGSKELSRDGAIVTRLAAIEDMAGMSILCSDKTGTLTMNKMIIQDETPIYKDGENQYTILRYAAMAAKWKEPPRDALDTLTLGAVDIHSLESVTQLDYLPFDSITKRTEGTIQDKMTGEVFKTSKGAPHVILKLVEDSIEKNSVCCVFMLYHSKFISIFCPSIKGIDVKRSFETFKARIEADIAHLGMRGIRSLAVAKTGDIRVTSDELAKEPTWQILGLLAFLDPPRPDTKETIAAAER